MLLILLWLITEDFDTDEKLRFLSTKLREPWTGSNVLDMDAVKLTLRRAIMRLAAASAEAIV